MTQIQFLLIKKEIGRPEHFHTLPLLLPIAFYFSLSKTLSQNGRHLYVTTNLMQQMYVDQCFLKIACLSKILKWIV